MMIYKSYITNIRIKVWKFWPSLAINSENKYVSNSSILLTTYCFLYQYAGFHHDFNNSDPNPNRNLVPMKKFAPLPELNSKSHSKSLIKSM